MMNTFVVDTDRCMQVNAGAEMRSNMKMRKSKNWNIKILGLKEHVKGCGKM